jgi:TonB family protein
MSAPENADAYYPRASLRLGQEGSVVLHFSIGPDGKVTGPIIHDEPLMVDQGYPLDDRASLRLIEGAEKYIRTAKFDARGIHKRQVTASFVFEVKPCGTLAHSSIHDYAIRLCLERPPPPQVVTP